MNPDYNWNDISWIKPTSNFYNADCLQTKNNLLQFFFHEFSHRKFLIYKCEEMNVFTQSCIKEMESMDPQQIATTFLNFLQRWEFM